MRTVEDLAPWARRAFEQAYADLSNRRERCSREDFASGWIAALEYLRSESSFTRPSAPDRQP